jgi:hypothetical protein
LNKISANDEFAQRQSLQRIKAHRGKMGKTDEEVVRAAFMLWYQANRMKPHWIRPEGIGCLRWTDGD